jgi:hypothetical protein
MHSMDEGVLPMRKGLNMFALNNRSSALPTHFAPLPEGLME